VRREEKGKLVKKTDKEQGKNEKMG